jgi:hypothetical protein
VQLGLAGGTLRCDATGITFWPQFGRKATRPGYTRTGKFPQMARTGNFQPLPCYEELPKSRCRWKTARVNPENGNFWQHFQDAIASGRSFPPVAP